MIHRRRYSLLSRCSAVVAIIACVGWCLSEYASSAAPTDASSNIKRESFDHDPGWEGWNNHITPNPAKVVTQDFGYSATAFSTDRKSELGGTIQRSTLPAYFAARVPPRTLGEPFSASGTFALTRSSPSSGIFFGLFNGDQPGGGGRAVNSIGMDFDGERHGARLAVRMINSVNKSCGTFITPFVPGKYRPTPIRNDGTRYTWKLTYDPAAHQGDGQFTFLLTSNGNKEEFEGKTFFVNLPPGFKKENATFDRFGLLAGMKTGGAMSIHFGDLTLDGKPLDPSEESQWTGQNNRGQFHESAVLGAHNFGFSEKTSFAGGAPGEVGGDLWRSGKYAFYADKVGPLALDRPLHAAGRVILQVGAPDSDMCIGFFDGSIKDKPPANSDNFLGIHVGGPTRIGHYFSPAYATARGTIGHTKTGPILTPGKPLSWSLDYDPAAGNGSGEIVVKLGDESINLSLRRNAKSEGAHFDHFGLFTSDIGGQLVRIYFDDLEYTAK